MTASFRSTITYDDMHTLEINARPSHLSHTQELREAILLIFCTPVPEQCALLEGLSDRQWKPLLHWLDTSGLALYFLDRLTTLGLREILPPAVLSRLAQNLVDSRARIDAMIAESNAIQRSFQNIGLSYAVLKGFSLWPTSVPKLELRSQLDIDFLMAEKSSTEARKILEARGYHLHAISGRSWEFKANQSAAYTLKDLYKPTPQRSVELHIDIPDERKGSLLERTDNICFHGVCMPVLSPVDLFLGQALHLYKHLRSEFSRASHILEFRNHVIARYQDCLFWEQLRAIGEGDSRATTGLGFVTLLISQTMGEFAPKDLTCWTVDRLPAQMRKWIELYGFRTVFRSFTGSKLHLLLETGAQMPGSPSRRSLRRALLPLRLPPAIAQAEPNETPRAWLRRHHRQAYFILFRLRFHVIEGLRYLYESIRWRRHLRQLQR